MKRIIVLSMLTLLMSSCIISLHPLYDDNTMVKEIELNGKWITTNDDTPSKWQFTPKMNEDHSFTGKYKLMHTTEGYTYEYEAVLLKLGRNYYLDILLEDPVPVEEASESEAPVLALYIPSHNFYKVEFKKEGQVHILPFDGHRLEQLVNQRKIRIKHEMVDDTMVITASTEDLQKFLLKYAQDKQAFDDPLLLKKIVD